MPITSTTSTTRPPTAAATRRLKRTLVAPCSIQGEEENEIFEASLHEVPRSLHSEIALVFPDLKTDRNSGRQLLALPTYHAAQFSILEINEATEAERLRLFLRFRDFASSFRDQLTKLDPDAFLDIPDIDGAAAFSRSTMTIYDEVTSTRSLLGYSTFLYMGVQMVQHPRFGYAKLALHTMIVWAQKEDVQMLLLDQKPVPVEDKQ
jgi:hypothetical protein